MDSGSGGSYGIPQKRLHGHGHFVSDVVLSSDGHFALSGSWDKTLRLWDLSTGNTTRRFESHTKDVMSVAFSADNRQIVSGSRDKTLRLWDLSTGNTTRRFESHTKDVNSVAFSGDNRQIVSGSRDKSIKLWNTLAECKYTIQEDMHTDWVSSVVFSPSAKMPLIVSAGWDKLVKVWNLSNCKLRTNLVGHTGVVYTCTVS